MTSAERVRKFQAKYPERCREYAPGGHPTITIPDYPVATCTCCGQHLSEDVLRGMGL